MLLAFTSLPGCVTMVLRGMPTVWRGRQRLIFCWRICLQAVSPGRQTMAAMARWTPATITAWRFGRVLQAAAGNVPLLVRWLAQALGATLPAPANGILSLCGEGSHADQRGPKPPVAQQGRLSQHPPWVLGLRGVLLLAAWDGYRLPVGFRRMRPPRHAGSRRATALLRDMVEACVPPRGAQLVSGGGEAAEGSKATRRLVQDRDKADAARRWSCVCASARTWQTVEEHSLTTRVPHGPHTDDQGPRVPRAHAGQGRKTCWPYQTCGHLRHVGEVPGVLSKRGRHVGPKPTQILGTNRAERTPSQVVGLDQKRWAVEGMPGERKSGLGLGEHHVSGDTNRSEQSMGMAVLASLFGLRVCHHAIAPGKPWSIFQLQQALRLRVMTNQVEHQVKVKMAKTRKAA